MSIALLVVGALCLLSAACTVARLTRPFDLVTLWFLLSFPLGEVPFLALGLQAVTAAVLVALGALDHTSGVVGLGLMLASWPLLVVLQRRAGRTPDLIDAAFAEVGLPTAHREPISRRALLTPFRRLGPGVRRTRGLSYGPWGKRNALDVFTPEHGVTGAPVLIFIHGGAWVSGSNATQGLPLISHLVNRGWVCVSINYRLGPKARWPSMLEDVKAAIGWVREHIGSHGGDPSFIALSGGSAGGHLSAVVALDPEVDVQAAVPCYGTYDLLNSIGTRGRRNNMTFLAKYVMEGPSAQHLGAWEAASPLTRTHVDAPPFFVLHGDHDSLLPVEDTRHFVSTLRSVSRQPVVYAELAGAQHAFDIFWSVRAMSAAEGIGRFLDACRQAQAVLPSSAKESRTQSA